MSEGESLTACSHEVEAPSSTRRRRSMKPRSEVWGYFDRTVDADGNIKGKCKSCGKLFCALKRNGTSALRSHIRNCKDHPHEIETRQALSTQKERDDSFSSSSTWKFDELSIRTALTVMIIHDELSFKFVEGTGFKYFMAMACPGFHIPSRWTIQRDCYQLYLEEKLKLKKFLKESCERVCLTIDIWSSLQKVNYLCLTAHWIDCDWKLNKRILNFCPVIGQRGDDLARTVESCLFDWGIDKVFTITVEKAYSNEIMVNQLKRRFNNRGNNVLQGMFLQVRCITHIINLIALDVMKSVNPSVSRVRGAVKYVRQSPSSLQKFRTCVEIEKIQCKSSLCVDDSTRWSSTYLMLDSALKFERAFDMFEERHPLYITKLESEDGVPSYNDWINVRRLCTFLQCFYNLTLRVSGSLYVTCNNFFHEIWMMYYLLQMWGTSDDAGLSSMAQKLQKKYDSKDNERMDMLIYVAVVLDPRYKMVYVEVTLKDLYMQEQHTSMVSKVKESMAVLVNEYKAMYQVQSGHAIGISLASHEMVNDEAQSVDPRFRFKKLMAASGLAQTSHEMMNEEAQSIDRRSRFKKLRAPSDVQDNIAELDVYLSEKLEADVEGFDILHYWKVNSSRFPVLSRLARDVLAVPISAVALESAFNTGGRVLDCFRSSLTPKIVQSFLCMEDWLRATTLIPKINIEEDLADLEKIEAELSGIAQEPTISVM